MRDLIDGDILIVSREAEFYHSYEFARKLISDGVSPERDHVFFFDITDFIYKPNNNIAWLKNKNIIPESNVHSIEKEYARMNDGQDLTKHDLLEIERIENTYGTTRGLWQQLMTDTRAIDCYYRDWYGFSSHSDLIKIITTLYQKTEDLFTKNSFKAVFDLNNIYLGRNIIFEVAQKNNIPHLFPTLARIGEKVFVSTTFGIEPEEEISKEMQNSLLNTSPGSQYVQNFRTSLAPYGGHKELEKHVSKHHSFIGSSKFVLYNILRGFYIRLFSKEHVTGFFSKEIFTSNGYKVFIFWCKYFYRIQYLSLFSRKIFTTDLPAEDQSYIYYPLHAIPENSTVVNAPFFTNEIANIELIAKSIPFGFKLIVKEHSIMLGYRYLNFYKALQKIPNVVLISPSYSGPQIGKKAKMTITLTGTSALESIMLGIPAIIFGSTEFEKCDGIFKLKDLASLPKLIKHALNYKPEPKSVESYISAVINLCSDINLRAVSLVYKESDLKSEKRLEDFNKAFSDLYALFKTKLRYLKKEGKLS